MIRKIFLTMALLLSLSFGAAAQTTNTKSGRERMIEFAKKYEEKEGVFTVCCAGGVRVNATIPLTFESVPADSVAYKITVSGLMGGHSGADIHLGRANANKVMAEFLRRIQELMPICITKLTGGAKDNAIPRSCQATLVAMGIGLERINGIAEQECFTDLLYAG